MRLDAIEDLVKDVSDPQERQRRLDELLDAAINADGPEQRRLFECLRRGWESHGNPPMGGKRRRR